ncbi:hypothetical protein PR202_gb14461 [Eleusine coracana subsp. coracana]|uniref:Uncharacterized protein n=1 Tax=Eleusine coracana subsp. coracana TaxID=191504 RepID=A0AAV5EVI0_ELECO|nr:hypothetical protein PR202_gb14461 [Eleusine coracana subsp. coracana]
MTANGKLATHRCSSSAERDDKGSHGGERRDAAEEPGRKAGGSWCPAQNANLSTLKKIEQPENIATCIATAPCPKSQVSSFFKKLKLCK